MAPASSTAPTSASGAQWYRMVTDLIRAEGGQSDGHRTEYRHFNLVTRVRRLRAAGWRLEARGTPRHPLRRRRAPSVPSGERPPG